MTLAGEVPDKASSNAQASEAMKMESQPAPKPPTYNPQRLPPTSRRMVA
jgi:hypothetical protein